jgi:hypothetical protein
LLPVALLASLAVSYVTRSLNRGGSVKAMLEVHARESGIAPPISMTTSGEGASP